MFDIEAKFQDIISELQKGNRPLFKMSDEELSSFQEQFIQIIEKKDIEGIRQCLCLLDHNQNYGEKWKEILIQVIQLENDELTILALGTSHRHIIDYSQRQGNRIKFDFLKLLEDLLETKNPELFEWNLRTIEALGGQSAFFKQKVLASRPGFLKGLQKKWKNSVELIKFLENKWNV